jgi:ABC-type lipoprotein release transport system permease subunit
MGWINSNHGQAVESSLVQSHTNRRNDWKDDGDRWGIYCSRFANWPPLVSWQMILVAVVFSGTVGIFFDLYTANKAAMMDPIEALRYD